MKDGLAEIQQTEVLARYTGKWYRLLQATEGDLALHKYSYLKLQWKWYSVKAIADQTTDREPMTIKDNVNKSGKVNIQQHITYISSK